MLIIVLTVANDVIIGAILPYIRAVFLIAKSFKRRYEPRRNGVLHCRDRRPRRSVSRAFYPKHNMDMIWHNHITLNGQIIVKVAQLVDVFIRDLSVFCQFDLRTVGSLLQGRTVPTMRERTQRLSFVHMVRNTAWFRL